MPVESKWNRTLVYAGLVLACLVFLFPFYWLVNSSLKGPGVFMEYPPAFVPKEHVTAPVPRTRLLVFQMEIEGETVDAVSLDHIPTHDYLLLVRDGEVTSDLRDVAAPFPWRPTGRTIEFGGRDAPTVTLQATGQVRKVIARRDTPQGEILYVAPLDWRAPTHGVMHGTYESDVKWRYRLAPRWRNYVDAFRKLPFATFFRNSFFICIMTTLGQLISASLVAYAFARIRFRGRESLFMVLLATMMIPAEITLIPLFVGWKHFHVNFFGLFELRGVDSFLPLIVPQFCAGAFNVFLLRQFFLTIPTELDEAAEIDGCSKFGRSSGSGRT